MKGSVEAFVKEAVGARTLRYMGYATFATTTHIIASRGGWIGWLCCRSHLPEIGDAHPSLAGMVAYKRTLVTVRRKRRHRRWNRPRMAIVLVFYEIDGSREWWEAVTAHFMGACVKDPVAERLKGLVD